MGKLYRGTCSICGETFAARKKTTLLSKMSKHRWKEHKNVMSRRIKAGKKRSYENPSIQDFLTALQQGTRSALDVYKKLDERTYQNIKQVMDALESLLPLEIKVAWKAIEAIHDTLFYGDNK